MVLRSAGRDGEDLDREPVHASARSARRNPLLDGHQPRGRPASRPGGSPEQRRPLDRRAGVPVLLAGVQQRSSPRAHRGSRRTAHLVLHRARHRHRTSAARGHGNLDRRLHSCRRTHRIDVYRSPSRRCAPVGAHRRQASPTGRHPAASRSDRRCRNHRAGGHLRRPDLCRRHGSHARPNDHRPQSRVVPGLPALLLPLRPDGRRLGCPTLRVLDDDPVPLHDALRVVAPRPRPRRGNRSVVAPGRRRLRHDVPDDVQPHQVDSPLRCVRGHRRFSRRADRRGRVRVRPALAS